MKWRWIWIRHGETEHNSAKRYLGHLDPPLNQQGKVQASRLLSAIKLVPKFVYSSDLQRCLETASPLCSRLNLDPIPVSALRELDFGEWDGLTYEEILAKDPDRLHAWMENPWDMAPPGGEILKDLGKRVDDWLYGLRNGMDREESAIIISHGGVIRWFQSRWLCGDASLFWQVQGVPHGEGLIAEWDGGAWSVDWLPIPEGGTAK